MIAVLGRLLWRAMRRVGRAVRDVYCDQVRAWECFWQAGRAPVPRPGPMAWVNSLDGYRLVGSYLPEPEPPACPSSRTIHDLRLLPRPTPR